MEVVTANKIDLFMPSDCCMYHHGDLVEVDEACTLGIHTLCYCFYTWIVVIALLTDETDSGNHFL